MRYAGDFSSLLFLDPRDAEDRHDCPFCGCEITAQSPWATITWHDRAYLAHPECARNHTITAEDLSNHDTN